MAIRIYAGKAELGGVWKKKSARDQSEYLAVTLDDPSFATPIYAAMFERRDEPDIYDLVWERSAREQRAAAAPLAREAPMTCVRADMAA
ncbi:MAG: DUF736 family protein [Janthinobacterium lividum]